MRQVPKVLASLPFLIIGNGRLAKHFIKYFNLLGVNYKHWYRSSSIKLSKILQNNYKILILINDDKIDGFILENKLQSYNNSLLIHCSGSLISSYAVGVHPLMTFSNSLYDLETYKSIPFVVDSKEIEFNQLFPDLENKSYYIPIEKKALYHVWCSMAGNFTSILWINLFSTFKNEFDLEESVAAPYLTQICKNLLQESDPLTGPLKRGDKRTIATHIATLENHPFQKVYKTFVEAYNKSELDKK